MGYPITIDQILLIADKKHRGFLMREFQKGHFEGGGVINK